MPEITYRYGFLTVRRKTCACRCSGARRCAPTGPYVHREPRAAAIGHQPDGARRPALQPPCRSWPTAPVTGRTGQKPGCSRRSGWRGHRRGPHRGLERALRRFLPHHHTRHGATAVRARRPPGRRRPPDGHLRPAALYRMRMDHPAGQPADRARPGNNVVIDLLPLPPARDTLKGRRLPGMAGGCASRESSARRSHRPRGGRVTARPRPRRGPRRPQSWPARHHGPVWPREHSRSGRLAWHGPAERPRPATAGHRSR